MTVSWDHTALPIECDDAVTEKALWKLHRDLWTLAFPALGHLYEMMLHDIDEHVTIHPKHPELWFYRGKNDDSGLDQVSKTALRYGFPADEFNNPTFAYEVVHHWFRLGLAVAFDRAVKMAAQRGIRIQVPSLHEELSQSHWRLARVSGGYRQVVANGDSISLFSADGWTPLEQIESAYHDHVREVVGSGCGCIFCSRYRKRARSILERPAWEAVSAELRAEHSGIALFVAMLQRRIIEAKDDPERYGWALLEFARSTAAKAVHANPEGASVILPFLETASVATAPAALAVSIAFVGAKSKPRIAMLPVLKAVIATDDVHALARAVRVLMPDTCRRPPILKKHLDEQLVTSLASMPDRLAAIESINVDPHRSLQFNAVKLGFSAVVHAKPAPGSLDVVKAWLTSEHPIVRATVASELCDKLRYGKGMNAYFDVVVEVATKKLLPEYLGVLLLRTDEVPAPLIEAMIALLPACELEPPELNNAARKVPGLKAAIDKMEGCIR